MWTVICSYSTTLYTNQVLSDGTPETIRATVERHKTQERREMKQAIIELAAAVRELAAAIKEGKEEHSPHTPL